MELNLGVVDQLYENGESTAKVARVLEDKYGIMQTFVDNNLQFIADQLANSVADNLETILGSGQKLGADTNLFTQGTNNIEQAFREFLDRNGTGIVTQASTQGTSGRFKDEGNKKKKRKKDPRLLEGQVRPSFVATGLYQASSKVWTNED